MEMTSAMLETRVNYEYYYASSSATSVGTASGKVFLLNPEEMGVDSFFAPLALFSGQGSPAATLEDGTTCEYWLRKGEGPMSAFFISEDGKITSHQCYYAAGIRPAVNIRAGTPVTTHTNADGHYELA